MWNVCETCRNIVCSDFAVFSRRRVVRNGARVSRLWSEHCFVHDFVTSGSTCEFFQYIVGNETYRWLCWQSSQKRTIRDLCSNWSKPCAPWTDQGEGSDPLSFPGASLKKQSEKVSAENRENGRTVLLCEVLQKDNSLGVPPPPPPRQTNALVGAA